MQHTTYTLLRNTQLHIIIKSYITDHNFYIHRNQSHKTVTADKKS